MERWYLVRYGLARHVGRFAAGAADYSRGREVVVRSRRGTELGEVIAPASPPEFPTTDAPARVLRDAGDDDRDRGRRAQAERSARFASCRRVLEDGLWPIEVVNAEALLDDARTVIHYLGPHRLDVHGIRAVLRDLCRLDVVFEPVGPDAELSAAVPDDSPTHPADEGGCGSCGAGGGCGTEGGCGTADAAGAHGSCSGCAVKSLVSDSRRRTARALV